MNKCLVVLLLLAMLALATAQRRFPAVHPGVCPPRIASQTCVQTCRDDSDCGQKHMKCCRTTCGRGVDGSICVQSVTSGRQDRKLKGGNCPAKPTGQWVCSPNCSFDSDCRGSLKCCRGRCPGSMLCQKPEP